MCSAERLTCYVTYDLNAKRGKFILFLYKIGLVILEVFLLIKKKIFIIFLLNFHIYAIYCDDTNILKITSLIRYINIKYTYNDRYSQREIIPVLSKTTNFILNFFFFLVLLVIQYCIEKALNYYKEGTLFEVSCFNIENNLNYIRHREDYNK